VSKSYVSGGGALSQVDLELSCGAVIALVGANGAGKTTLLRILAGLLAPDAGEVEVLGVERPAAAGARAAQALRRRLAYVPQDPALDPEMTGRETLELLAALYGVPRTARRARVAAQAEGFGIASHLPRRVAAWSGGLRRRLHLAAGMLHDAELLLLDEPTAGLDDAGSAALWAELTRRAAAGAAVAVVTHDLAAVERHAQRVVILEAGWVAAGGSPRELMAAFGVSSLAEAYRRATGRDPAALLPPGDSARSRPAPPRAGAPEVTE
jgi:ABC-2 type transport system ATP-binding protein